MSVPGVQLRISLVLGHQLPFPPSAGGGVNNLLWSLARQFRRDGHLVTVCSPLTKGLRRDEIDADGMPFDPAMWSDWLAAVAVVRGRGSLRRVD